MSLSCSYSKESIHVLPSITFTDSLFQIQNSDPQELPSRVKKDILHAADFHHNGQVTAEGLQRIVQNIGAQHSVSKEDVHLIVLELGNQEEDTGSKDSVSVRTLLRVL